MKSITNLVVVLTAILGITGSAEVQAQNKLALTTMELNPFTAGRLDRALRSLRGAMDETDTPFYWLVAESESGNNHYMIANYYDSYSVMDLNINPAIGSAMDEEEIRQFVGDLQFSVAKMSTVRYVARPDLSRANPTPASEPPDGVIVMQIDVVNGKNDEFEAFMAQVIEATDATAPDVYWGAMSPVFGGSGYMIAVMIDKWEDLDTPSKSVEQRLVEHFGGRRGERMMDGTSGFIANIQTNLYKTRPDIVRPRPQ